MVLVGAVTFSVTNALLADPSSKRLAKGHPSTNSGHQKIADNINQTDKTLKDQTPITDVKDTQPTLSNNIAAPQAVLENGNMNDQATAAIQKNTTTISATSTTASTTAPTINTAPVINTEPTINTAPVINTEPATNTAPATNTTTNSNTTAAGTTSTKSATTTAPTTTTTAPTTNHGQQVSQAAKDKAASRKG
jgi:hypothetical protein